jgi:ribosome-associated protein
MQTDGSQEQGATPKRVAGSTVSSRDRAILAARTAADTRAKDVLVLDMTEIVRWTDYLVVATSASRRQMRSVADAVEKALAEVGDRKIGVEGYELGEWIVVDFADVVLHVFTEEKRGYYEIEHLWGDAPRVEWERPNPQSAAPRD